MDLDIMSGLMSGFALFSYYKSIYLDMKKYLEEYVRDHCNIEYNKATGEEMVNSTLAAVMIAFDEYAKDLKKSLKDFDDFGFGDAHGDVPNTPISCGGNCRRPDKSI